MTDTCSFKGCNHKAIALSLCVGHYAQKRRGQLLKPLRGYMRVEPYKGHSKYDGCSFDGCDRPHSAKGLCKAHYAQASRGRPLTEIRGYARD